MSHLLVIDADERQRARIVNFFSGNGYSPVAVPNTEEALALQEHRVFDIVIVDCVADDQPVASFIESAASLGPDSTFIVSHVEGASEDAVAAVRAGAYDSIQKPYTLAELYVKVENAVRHRRLELEAQSLRGERDLIYQTGNFVGHSPRIREVLVQVHKVARSDSSVLLLGESGTGKELLAGAIHYNSHRSTGAFVRVNCAALPEELLESELFGHEKGAFTGAEKQRIGRFEQAGGGSIFLDEIADMSLRTQAKVLRVLQEKEFERVGSSRTIRVDVRVISATNKDLSHEIAEGNFREDLYYRLNVVAIHLPPLRDRHEDIMPLVEYFVKRYSGDMKKHVSDVSEEAREALLTYSWPGNIRELQNTVERAVLLSESSVLRAGDFGLPTTGRAAGSPGTTEHGGELVHLPPDGASLAEIEREAIIQALERCSWVQKDAADLLQVSRRVLNYKIQQHGITHASWKRNV